MSVLVLLYRAAFIAAVPRKKPPVDTDQLRNWKLVENFRSRVLPHLHERKLTPSELDPRRTLQVLDYLSAFLLAMFNPAFTSLRSLAHASHCKRMRQVTAKPFSAASFSEAQHLFDPQILAAVLRQLAVEIKAKALDTESDPRVREALESLVAVDGTVFRALDRMTWAPGGGPGQSVRLHLQFSVLDQLPSQWVIAPGKVFESKIFRQHVQAGQFYVADRLYGCDYRLLAELQAAGAHFVFRTRGDAVAKPLGPEQPLSAEAKAAGVVSDRMVRLGLLPNGPEVRLVIVRSGGNEFHLLTSRQDLPAELISLIYRQRWQIELYFKWLKTIINCRHWFAESERGAAMQIYAAMICSLLLRLWTGKNPNKRFVEALRWWQSGFASDQDFAVMAARALKIKS